MKKIIIFALLILASKTYAQNELDKYQKKIYGVWELYDKASTNKYVKLSVGNNPKPTVYAPPSVATKRNIFNLSEKGQKAYIEALNAKSADAKALIGSLPTTLEPKSGDQPSLLIKTADYLKKLEIVVSNEKNLTCDRIAELEVTVTLDDNAPVEFVGFNNLTTKYISTDFGTLSVSKTRGFTINGGLNLGGTGSTTTTSGDNLSSTTKPDEFNTLTNGNTSGLTNVAGTSTTSNIGVGYSLNKTIAQQIAIKNSVVSMKGSMAKNEFTMYQHGAPNQDLNDNINVEFFLKPKAELTRNYFIIKGLFSIEDAPVIDDSKISVKKGYLTYAQISNNINATLTYKFVYRRVYEGKNTVRESDDKVDYFIVDDRQIDPISFDIVKANEMKTDVYFITCDNAHSQRLYMNYYNKRTEICFPDLMSALELGEWLRQTQKTAVKGCKLEVSSDGQNFTNYSASMLDNLEPLKVSL